MENFLEGVRVMVFAVGLALNGFKDPGEPPEPRDGI